MRKKSAFTMIELVMVIVVLGIVASIGAEIIANLYTSYLRTRAINRLEGQTEIVLEQIAKRLQYRVKDSVRASNNGGATWVPLPSALDTHNVIEWVGISNESFLGEHNGTSVVPGWSGLIDMENVGTASGARTLETTGSRLDYARNTILALTDNDVDMNVPAGDLPALIFKSPKPLYNVDNYFSQGIDNYTLRVSRSNDTRFSIPNDDNVTNGELFEQYYLSHSAYALTTVGTANDFNLSLVYNYQPWEGETFNGADSNSSVLVEHVSTFRIRQDGNVVRIKLCIHDNNQSGNFDFSACKEKVIF